MIYIATTREKFDRGIKLMMSHGGAHKVKSERSGTLTCKVLGSQIVAEYTFANGEASFMLVQKPFFIPESQIERYVANALA
jgi:hypothetical protein